MTPNMTAITSLMANQYAKAVQESVDRGRTYSRGVEQANDRQAQDASREISSRAKGFSEAAFTVSIQVTSEASLRPRLSSMSPPLQEYLRVSHF